MTTINAFHPQYVETYMPEFMSTLRKENKAIEDGKLYGGKSRATREAANCPDFNTIAAFPKTKKRTTYQAPRVDLAPLQYYTCSKAGVK